MIAENMFWEVWRNVTSAKNNWSLGGNNSTTKGQPSNSAQRTRYNRLGSGPTKSLSQPANLTSLVSYASSESLEDNTIDLLHNARKEDLKLDSKKSSGKNSNRHNNNNGSTSFMKQSISSFFPFTSCTSSSTKVGPSNSLETSLPVKSSSSVPRIMEDQQQKECASLHGKDNVGTGILSNSCSSTGESGDNGVYHHDSQTTGGNPSLDQEQCAKEVSQNCVERPIYEEDDEISDLDDEVEHLTCDVCDRAFPTLKMLAVHQKKKRHYGCLQCDSIFPSREVLEYHREQMCHYDYAIDFYEEGDEEGDFLESEDDENGIRDEDCDDEERERLL